MKNRNIGLGLISQLLIAVLFAVAAAEWNPYLGLVVFALVMLLPFISTPKGVAGDGIAVTDGRALFTKTLIDVYQQRLKPTSFLRSFFPVDLSPTKEVSIEVERQGEFVAVDIFRGTEGNRNSWSLSTEKIFVPPLYKEYFDATQLDLYDRVLGSQGNAQVPLFAALMNKVADRIGTLQDKIERAFEYQCAQVLQTGQITMFAGSTIDYKRKATSIVDLNVGSGGGYFAANSDVFKQFQNGCDFLRTVGKSGDAVFNAIFGATALADFLANTKFTARQNLFNMALDAVAAPTRNATGAAYHGTITAGGYKVQLWSYPQFYDTLVSGVLTSNNYIDPKNVILIPTAPRFKLGHAAVPQLIGQPGEMPSQGEYVVSEFLDTRNKSHDYIIESAAVAIPVAVDQIYTMKAVA